MAMMIREVLVLICLISLLTAQPINYLIFGKTGEGDYTEQIKQMFGEIDPSQQRMYAFSPTELPVLTRSVDYLQRKINEGFDIAEKLGIPIAFHVDPLYAWGADLELNPSDAPSIKYWNHEKMREWSSFPEEGKEYSKRIPRQWFYWGSWCSPAPAFPALGSEDFMNFVLKQMQDGVAKPLRNRYENLKKVNKEYLFAGINIAWENGMNQIPRLDKLPTAAEPIQSRGIQMQVWESGAQLGYASLHWNGYNNSRLIREAILARITPKQMFTTLMWEIISDYNILLSKTISDVGVPRTHIFTHQVAIPTVDKSKASALWPPVWVNVNDFSTPGFTMDNRGSAVFDIDTIKQQIKQVDKNQKYYAAVETYLQHYHDESSLTQNLKETFESGAIVKWLYGAYPVGGEFGLDVDPVNATLAIKKWLLNK